MKKICTVIAISIIASSALSANVVVEMLTKDKDGNRNVFSPAFVKINVGDSISFKSIQRGHNSSALKKTLPEGAKKWHGRLGKDITVTFDKDGLYGYKCTPHVGLGMVGVIQVGTPINQKKFKSAIKKVPGKGKRVLQKIYNDNVK